MKFLEYKDENNEIKLMSLEGYKNIGYPISSDMKQEAILYTHDNQVAIIPGTDFKIVD
ncbi:hypothetical protein ACODGR_03170 [Vagococcus fluvialis]|uniref:hypothetical protein n=1 Tax=Vagococcus TaxID=2737 RepID=UPI00288CB89F|nr:hypothetical protein [Vagococcus carniphilus]MDT2839311.1 hypothetical protein [Vagococcus carniphilus]